MRRLYSSIVATLALATVPFAVQAAQPMTLTDAVSYALGHSPVVAQKVAAVTQARNIYAQERIVALPTVIGSLQNSLGKSENFGGGFASVGLSQQNIYSQNTAQIGTNYTLQTGGAALLTLASMKASLSQAEQDLANTEDQLAVTITNAYYSVVQKRALVTLDGSDLEYQNALVEAAQAKEQAGVAAGVDVLRARVAQAKSRSTLVAAKADVDNGRETLAVSIGAPLDTDFAFPQAITMPSLPSQSTEQLENTALRSRPDVKSSKDALIAAQLNRRSFDRSLFPQVQVAAGVGNQVSTTTVPEATNPNCFLLRNPLACGLPPVQLPRNKAGFWSIAATSTFSFPLVDYGARHFQRTNDDAQITSAQAAFDQVLAQARVDVRQSYRAAQTALTQLSYAREEAQLGAESARIARLQYQRGLIALSDVFQAQQQSVAAQADLVNARVAYVQAVVKLRISLGIYDARSAVADLR